jgi:hypothetical protein
MVGEIKKGRCVYYHCTGFKGKCPGHTRARKCWRRSSRAC